MTIQVPFAVVPLSLGTITTGNERVNRPASNLSEVKDAGMVWQSNGNTNLWVRCDLGTAKEIDFIGLMAANALAGTTIRVRIGDTQAEVDGTADYDSGVLPFISPSITREDGLYHSHLELPLLITKRWVRIDIAGHTGDFEGSSLVIGKKIQPARYYNPDFSHGVEDMGGVEFGLLGVTSEENGIKLRQLSFRLSWMTAAEYESMFRPMMEKVGGTGFVYWCFDSDPTIYRQAKTYLGVMSKSLAVIGSQKPRTYAAQFDVLSPY